MLNVYEFATVSELGLSVVLVGGGKETLNDYCSFLSSSTENFYHNKVKQSLRILVAKRNHLQETSVAAYL